MKFLDASMALKVISKRFKEKWKELLKKKKKKIIVASVLFSLSISSLFFNRKIKWTIKGNINE